MRLQGYGAVLALAGVVVDGIRRSRGLSSRGFLCLASLPSLLPLPGSTAPSRTCCIHFTMAPFISSLVLDINDKWLDFVRDGDVVEQEVGGRVAAP